MEPQAAQAWSAIEARLRAEGLNVWLLRSRDDLEPAFAARANDAVPGANKAVPGAPSAVHNTYRTAVLLGSAGTSFWERCGAARDSGEPDPLDRHTEHTVEGALEDLRRADPSVIAAYPFAHQRRIIPFLAMLEGSSLMQHTPFGVSLHPRFGPWFAWRAVLLTGLDLPATPSPGANPCATCPSPCAPSSPSPCTASPSSPCTVSLPSPCEEACPAGAVAKTGFDWQACVNHRAAEERGRVAENTCRETCLARQACPVGPEYRYSGEQMAYHYGISLRTILAEGWAGTKDAGS